MSEREPSLGGLADVAMLVVERCPGWEVSSVELLGAGDFTTAYLVNGAWVFRFAKHERAAASLAREARLLPAVARQFDVAVPHPEVVSVRERPAFTAHRLLPWPALTKEEYLALSEEGRTRCAAAVAGFLVQLHATDVRLARACGVQTVDYNAREAGILTAARRHLFGNLRPSERSFVEDVVADRVQAPEPRAVVLHGDLSPDHVLYDDASASVAGVIDFGDVAIGDPAWDFVYLYEDYGLDFLRRCLPAYSPPDVRSFLERVFRFHVLDLVEWAARCVVDEAPEREEAERELVRLRDESHDRREELLALARR